MSTIKCLHIKINISYPFVFASNLRRLSYCPIYDGMIFLLIVLILANITVLSNHYRISCQCRKTKFSLRLKFDVHSLSHLQSIIFSIFLQLLDFYDFWNKILQIFSCVIINFTHDFKRDLIKQITRQVQCIPSTCLIYFEITFHEHNEFLIKRVSFMQ